MQGDGTAALSSPWDVAWWRDRVWVAMAGIHQLWTLDPRTGAVEVAGGTTNEGLLDGPLDEAWFAQTSGLAADGDRLWIADSETSSLRYVEDGAVHDRGRHRAVRLRLPRRRGRRGAAPAPARGDRAARRVGGGLRHLQRRRTALGGRRADHARDRPGRAERRACVDGRAPRRGRVRGAPADPGPAGRRRRGGRVRAHHPAAGHRDRRRGGGAGGGLHPAAGAEGRRPVRAAVPAARVRDAAAPCSATATVAAPTSTRVLRSRRGRRRRRAARRRAGRLLRRARGARARRATCTSRTGASRSGWSRAAPRGWCCRCPAWPRTPRGDGGTAARGLGAARRTGGVRGRRRRHFPWETGTPHGKFTVGGASFSASPGKRRPRPRRRGGGLPVVVGAPSRRC